MDGKYKLPDGVGTTDYGKALAYDLGFFRLGEFTANGINK